MQVKMGIAQLNSCVGDIKGNIQKAVSVIEQAKIDGVDIIVFPEMFVTGYPPNDILLCEEFVRDAYSSLLNYIVPVTDNICVIMGNIKIIDGHLRNCAVVIQNKEKKEDVIKTLLPSYDIFDEKRYFVGANDRSICPVRVSIKGHKIMMGVEICEDLWFDSKLYDVNPTELLCERGADIIINISASPFYSNKMPVRIGLAKKYVDKFRVPFVYANLVGGQDDTLFDGGSFLVDANGKFAAMLPQFKECTSYAIFDTDTWNLVGKECQYEVFSKEEQIFNALVLNVRDYYEKSNCFNGIAIGSSGGIDSALSLVVAAEAVGRDKVLSVAMPSEFTSGDSIVFAEDLAAKLGINHITIPINKMYDAALETYDKVFGNTIFGIAEENDQARCRMMLLMKLSAKNKYLICSTGNKSELSVGYFTLYGDSAGGKNILGDLYKTEVYDVSRYINESAGKEIIPYSIINRPPTAELRPGQKDSDSLPPYEILDRILAAIEDNVTYEKILMLDGVNKEQVDKVLDLYRIAEFKRSQLPKGIKVSKKAFGIGRRIPIVNKWDYRR